MDNGREKSDYDSRPRHVEKSEGSSKAINGEIVEEPTENAASENARAEEEISDRSKELVSAAKVLDQASPEELEEAGIIAVSETQMVSFSGILPHPSVFKEYDKDTQEWIKECSGAFTIDESKRQDRLVDNEIRQSNKSFNVSTFLIILSLVLSIVCYLISSNPWLSGLFVSYPIVSVIGNVISPVFSKSSNHNDKKKN